MEKLSAGILWIIGFSVFGVAAFADTYHDKNGQYLGNSSQSGNVTTYHDRNGTMTGTDRQSGNEIRHYDRNGQFQGSTRR